MADQAAGGQGLDNAYKCIPMGMPRQMSGTFPIEFVVTPKLTHILFELVIYSTRRIYTDARAFPTDEDPTYAGYSIGKWLDTDGDGRYDVLEVETRNLKGPRTFDETGIPFHENNQTVIKERFFLDKADPNLLHVEMIRHGETVNPPCNRKRRTGNPSPTAGRARSLSQPTGYQPGRTQALRLVASEPSLSLKRLSHSHIAVLDVSVSPQRVGPFARRVRDARYHL